MKKVQGELQSKRVLLVLVILTVLLTGCLGKKEETKEQVEVKFSYQLAAKLEKSIRRSAKRAPQSLKGQMTITDLITTTSTVKDWYVVIDEDAFSVVSKSTVVLKPSDYEFTLVLTQGNHRYTGTTTGVTINDGTNDVVLTLKPVIGEVNTNTNLTQTSNLNLKYETDELTNITDPKVGVIVDGGNEDIYTINKTTGLSSYVVLTAGNYHIDLKFYDGNKQIGKSVDAQENVDVNIVDIVMDIVPLHGETNFSLDLAGNDATFNFTIPSEIVDEVGGIANLEATLTLTSVVNGNQSGVIPFSFDGTNYVASHTYGNFRYDTVSIQLQFVDTTNSEEVASGLLANVELSENVNNQTIDISLIRRSVIQGNLFGVLGVTSYDVNNDPVVGAKVYVDDVLVGLTGSGGFGTTGYLKIYLEQGTYNIKVFNADETIHGETDITITELDILNENIVISEVIMTLNLLKYFDNGLGLPVNYNGEFYFQANTATYGKELWKSDGTVAGTVLVKDIMSGTGNGNPLQLTVFNNELYFSADNGINGNELWKTDGTESGTVLVKDINPGAQSSYNGRFTVVDNSLFFIARDGVYGSEIWKTDGTESGTVMVKDINPGANGCYPDKLISNGNELYFTANAGLGYELYISDGTEAGTTIVKDINSGTASSTPDKLVYNGTDLFFTADDGINGKELWKTDGSEAGTVLVKDINPSGNSDISNTISYNGELIFRATNGINGVEIWKSDGTESGTTMVKDMRTGSVGGYPEYFTLYKGELYFKGMDNTNGFELWKTDGTNSGTVIVKDIWSGNTGSNPMQFAVMNNYLYFTANDGVNGNELWKSDGTDSGTVLEQDIKTTGDSYPFYVTSVNDMLFFQATDDSDTIALFVYK